MFSKDVCRSGSYLQIIPNGLFVTAHYNKNGILQKMYRETTFEDWCTITNKPEVDERLVVQLEKFKLIPQRIPVKDTDTYIAGVFYNPNANLYDYDAEGTLPECIQDQVLQKLIDNPMEFNFYAINMKNKMTEVLTALPLMTKLRTFAFNVFPGFNIPDNNMNDNSFNKMVKKEAEPFNYPKIAGYMIFDLRDGYKYYPLNLKQFKVKKVTKKLDENGYIYLQIDGKSDTTNIQYPKAVQYDVQEKSLITLDTRSNNNLIHSCRPTDRNPLSRNSSCPICGRKLVVPVKGFASCEDIHCRSKLYYPIKHFLNVLQMDDMSFEEFLEYIQKDQILCLTDIFELDKYKKVKINCTLGQLIRAAIPVNVCANDDYIYEFVKLAGSSSGLDYYIHTPDQIPVDMPKLNPIITGNMIIWLSDPYNVSTLDTLLTMKNINTSGVDGVNKAFEGAPIFINKTICITGKFKNGNIDEITSILQSYSAKVVMEFSNTVNCVLVGHFRGEDTEITSLANAYQIPVFEESEFFDAYGINEDLSKQG